MGQLVINWTMHRPGITCALVGVRNAPQAEENAGAAAFALTADETAEINERLEELRLEAEGCRLQTAGTTKKTTAVSERMWLSETYSVSAEADRPRTLHTAIEIYPD